MENAGITDAKAQKLVGENNFFIRNNKLKDSIHKVQEKIT